MSTELESLIGRTTIKFTRPLGFREVKDLFRYIQRNLHGQIDYQYSSFGQIGAFLGDENYEKDYVSGVSGRIKITDSIFGCSFNLERSAEDEFRALKFSTIPGYELSEIPEDDLRLMDKVRIKIENYFREKTA